MGYKAEGKAGAALVQRAAKYLVRLFGGRLRPTPLQEAQGLPPYLSGPFLWHRLEVEGCPVLFMESVEEVPSPAAIEKHIAVARGRFQGPVAILLPELGAVARSRLLARRVPFLVPDEQLFLPELGLALRERFSRRRPRVKLLPPSATCLVVQALNGRIGLDDAVADIAAATGYTAMTVGRCLDTLESSGIVASSRVGKLRKVLAPATRRALWELARPFMDSPVASTLHLGERKPPKGALEAGYQALARLSQLAEPGRREYALGLKAARRLKLTAKYPAQEGGDKGGDEGGTHLQLWSFAPLASRGGTTVDPFSLCLSLAEDGDERVQQALGQALEDEWSRD